MALIGFILVGLAVAAAIILVVQNAGDVKVHALGWHWEIPGYWLAIAGLVIMAVFILGLLVWRVGAARGRRIRREHRQLTRERRQPTEPSETSPVVGAADETPAAPPIPSPGHPPTSSPGYPPTSPPANPPASQP